MNGTSWPGWKVRRLRELWDDDMLAQDIGDELGKTAQAVRDKAARLGLKRRHGRPGHPRVAELPSGSLELLRRLMADGLTKSEAIAWMGIQR